MSSPNRKEPWLRTIAGLKEDSLSEGRLAGIPPAFMEDASDGASPSYSWDANGNPTAYEGNSATWDPENRMPSYGSGFTAGYRSDGLRAWKSNGSTTTYFYYDQTGMPVMERQGSTLTAINTFGANGLISRWTSSGSVFYQFDERGDTAERLNSSGIVLDYHASGLQYSTGGSTDPYLGFGAQ